MPNNVIKKTKSGPKIPKQKGWLWLALITISLVLVIGIGTYIFFYNVNKVNYVDARIGSESFKLELADTDAKRTKGLSERDYLDLDKGMLFDFKQDGDWRIWMIQMRFPLDIIWLDAQKQVVYIKEDARPADFPERYHASEPSRYVVELNSSTARRVGLKVGDYITFNIP